MINLTCSNGNVINKHEAGQPKPILEVVSVYTLGDVFQRSLTDKIKSWVKLFRYSASYAEWLIPNAPEGIHLFGSKMGEMKNFLCFKEIYPRTCGVGASLFKVVQEPSIRAAITALHRCSDWTSSITGSASFISRCIPFDTTVLKAVASKNIIAKFVCALSAAVWDYQAFDKASKTLDIELQVALLLRLAIDLSYIAFGIFALAPLVLGGAPASALALLHCQTVETVLILISYFYNALYDPYHKNSDVNLEALRSHIKI